MSWRNKKKKIPKDTPYCYDRDYARDKKEPIDGYWIKPCAFYQPGIDGIDGYCRLVKCEVMDQVKECGQRCGY